MAVDLAALTAPSLEDKAINGHDPGANQAHWFLHDGATTDQAKARLDSISNDNLALFEVMGKRRAWADLEGAGSGTTSGTMDLAVIDRDIDHASERGIPFMILVENRSFDGSAAGPSDLTAQWQASEGSRRTLVMYHATPRTRYMNFIKAIIDRNKDKPYFCGVQCPGETAHGSNSAAANCTGATYSLATDQTGWNTLFKGVANHCTYTYCGFGWNFLSGLGGGSTQNQVETAWSAVFADVPTDNVVLFTPDILLPGSPDHFNGLDGRVYPLFNEDYYGVGNGFTSPILNFRRFSSMQHDSYRFSDNPADAGTGTGQYYYEKGDPTAEAGANDLDSDGVLDMHEQMIWAIRTDRLNLDGIIWTHHDFDSGNTVTFTFDRTDHVNGYGTTYGDAIGAIRQGWVTTHNPLYRNG